MIYAVVILVALAIAFIILVRRLPQAAEFNRTGNAAARATVTAATSVAATAVHSVQSAVKSKPQFSLAPLLAFFAKLGAGFSFAKLPKLRLPKRQPRAAKQETETTEAIHSDATASSVIDEPIEPTIHTANKADFWADRAEPKAHKAVAPEPPAAKVPAKPTPIAESPLKLLSREPAKGRNVFQEAEDAFAIKDYKKAERLFLRLATEDPKNPKIYGRLGIIYLEQKNYEDARDALQAAIKLEPAVATRHFNLAISYLQLGSRAKSIQAMEQALKYDPSNRKYRKMLDDILANRVEL